jgi:hypothetical protein
MPAAMFQSGWSIAPNSGRCDAICWYVDGMSCITPRAPTQLVALGFSSLSANPCALK